MIREIRVPKPRSIEDLKYVKEALSGYRILNTNDSYIQHIGIRSLCRPGRFIRCSRNFIQPYTWNEEF